MNNTIKPTNRNILLDLFKIIGACGIIAVHCGFLFDYSTLYNHMLCNGLFRIAIPFFFCVNGFFLYDVIQKKNFKTWLKRITILYAIWMLVYISFWIDPVMEKPFKIFSFLLFGFNHLWYLAALLVGGILLYALRNLSNKILLILAITLYSLGFLIQNATNFEAFQIQSVLSKLINFSPIHRNFLCFALPFLSIGYVIKRKNLHHNFPKQKALLFLITGIILLITETFLNHYFSSKASFNLSYSFIILSPSLLLAAYTFKTNINTKSKLLSAYSIALYLIHPMVIFVIISNFKITATLLTIITIMVTSLASYLIILLNKKLKYIL